MCPNPCSIVVNTLYLKVFVPEILVVQLKHPSLIFSGKTSSLHHFGQQRVYDGN